MIPSRKKPTDYRFICLCNGVTQSQVEQAIKNGADSLDKIFDKTQAGVGGCGGSCRVDLTAILEFYKKTGSFPQENPRQKRLKRPR